MSLDDIAKADMTKSGATTPTTRLSMSRLSVLDEEEEDFKPGELSQQRQHKKQHELCQEADYLFSTFNKRTQDALIRCTRVTLETIKRRVTSPSVLHYGDLNGDKKKRMETRPAFKASLSLAIPSVSLKPSLEDIQSALNEAVQHVLAVHKGVLQWTQLSNKPSNSTKIKLATQSSVLSEPVATLAVASSILATSPSVVSSSTQQNAVNNFFKLISEHKEILKLISIMSSTVSSAKALVNQSVDKFKKYEHLWMLDREENMTKFLQSKPGLSEFESEIRRYMELEEIISEEEDVLSVGSLALATGV